MEKKILIVDDELQMREMYYDIFSKKGYKVFTAPDGEEAVTVARQEKPDLILSEIRMPKLNGIEMLKKIRGFDPMTKIVMFTSIEDIESEKIARVNGASGFLRKSLGISVISMGVDAILEEKPGLGKVEEKKILIVDDNPQIRILLKDFLVKKGYNPIVAENGEEALTKLVSEKPVCVLLDIMMPGMDGLMTLKRIKEINEQIGVIMITGVEDENIAQEAMKLGAYSYIIKPIDFNHLEICLLAQIILLTG